MEKRKLIEKMKNMTIEEHHELLAESMARNCGWNYEYSGDWSESDFTNYADATNYFLDKSIKLNCDDMIEKYNHLKFESNGYTDTFLEIDNIVHLFSTASGFWYVFK